MGLLEDTYGPEIGKMMAQYGAISPEVKQKAKNDALMNAGFAMLASNGLGRTRNQSLGRALGAGGLAGVNTYNSSLEDAQKQQFGQMQMAGSLDKLMKQRQQQEKMLNYRNTLNPEDQMRFDVDPTGYLKQFDAYTLGEGQQRIQGGKVIAEGPPKTASQSPYFQFLPTANGYAVGDARTGKMSIPEGAPVRSTDDPALQGKIEGAKVAGKNYGDAESTANIELPKVISQAENNIRLIDELKSHPGFKTAVGKSSIFQLQKVPGTSAYDFMNRLEQVKGASFLQAFESMKGGGAISEVEGIKATQALNRMNNATSEDEFIAAADDLKGLMQSGVQRMQQKAGPAKQDKQAAPSVSITPTGKVLNAEQRAALDIIVKSGNATMIEQARAKGWIK